MVETAGGGGGGSGGEERAWNEVMDGWRRGEWGMLTEAYDLLRRGGRGNLLLLARSWFQLFRGKDFLSEPKLPKTRTS